METATAYAPAKYHTIAHVRADERPFAEALFEHLKSICVVRDHRPVLATVGEMRDKLCYVGACDKDDDLVIAIDEHARQYTTSMEHVSNAHEDFRAGWRALEKVVKAREQAAEIAREEAEAKKPLFAIYDSKYGEYAVIENDCYSHATGWASNATTWKTKRSAEKAREKHCGARWTVVNVREKV